MPGPARQPTRLKVLLGNPGHQKLNPDEPRPKIGAPRPPRWLDPIAVAEWKRLAPELERIGLLTVVDGIALAGYCQNFAIMRHAQAALDREGLTFTSSTGYVQQRPEVSIVQKSWQLVKAFGAEFGLTPGARGRMSVPGESGPDDTLGGLLD